MGRRLWWYCVCLKTCDIFEPSSKKVALTWGLELVACLCVDGLPTLMHHDCASKPADDSSIPSRANSRSPWTVDLLIESAS